jgi:hypothetical protein
MLVLESRISHVARNRDFGMVEACVTLIAKTQAGQPAHPLRLLVHVPVRGHAPLRQRLTAEATGLARAMSRSPAALKARGPRAA